MKHRVRIANGFLQTVIVCGTFFHGAMLQIFFHGPSPLPMRRRRKTRLCYGYWARRRCW
ncbi:MAG: hypothetical protein FD149_2020 [Rhodospirillaceae bacterium]|nr:MAG: hypothetical protein FD149_2020 [Rhodospirillaceae bacterium]